MDDLLVEVLIGLVIYLAGTMANARIQIRASTDIGRLSVLLAIFALLTTAYFTYVKTRYHFLAAILIYLVLLAIESAKPEQITRNSLERWFGDSSRDFMDGVKLPTDVNQRILRRAARTAQRQGSCYAKNIDFAVRIRGAKNDAYWQYDYTKTYRYGVERPQTAPFRLEVIPAFVERDSVGRYKHTRIASIRSNPTADKWTISAWPFILEADWAEFCRGISVTARQQSSANLSKQRDIPLKRIEARNSRNSNGDPVSSTPDLLEFAAMMDIDKEWDIFSYEIQGLHHFNGAPDIHFYAWDVCVGMWNFRVDVDETLGRDSLEIVRMIPITGYDIGVERENRSNFGEIRFHANDVAVLPDDAVVVTLRRVGSDHASAPHGDRHPAKPAVSPP